MDSDTRQKRSKSIAEVEKNICGLKNEKKKRFYPLYRGSKREFCSRSTINNGMLRLIRFYLANKIHELGIADGPEKAMEGVKVIPLILQFFERQQQRPINERQARNYAKSLASRETSVRIFREKSKRQGWRIQMIYNHHWISKILKLRARTLREKRRHEAEEKQKKKNEEQRKKNEEQRKKELQLQLKVTHLEREEELEELKDKFIEENNLDACAQLMFYGMNDYREKDEDNLGHRFLAFIEKQKFKQLKRRNRS
jgi:hypothetical protein